MPKQTFFNLPKHKQDVLIDAGFKEFSRVPLGEALISNIIASAEIPRGSFYQYFENKEDLFYHIFSLFGKKCEKAFMNTLKEKNGDLLATMEKVFELIINFLKDPQMRGFFKNAFMNMNHKVENAFAPGLKKETHSRVVKEFYKLIDLSKLNISEKSEIRHIVMIIKAVTVHNVMMNFAQNIDGEEAVAQYKTEIGLLRQGLYKREAD